MGDGKRRIDSGKIQEERIHKRRLGSGINGKQTEGDGYQMADGTGKDGMEYDVVLSSARTKLNDKREVGVAGEANGRIA
jgi:hypothetical protein